MPQKGCRSIYNLFVMKEILFTKVTFPNITLDRRDGHKLRGFFGNYFKDYSPLLHNHFDDGRSRFAYPLVQYKVVGGVPTLIGINEGAELLAELFIKMKTLNLYGMELPIFSKNIESRRLETGISKQLYTYRFGSLWMALNQSNYAEYCKSEGERRMEILKKILVGNILSFWKGIGYQATDTLMVMPTTYEKLTRFKEQDMLAFEGSFVANALLPELVGIGRSVSRGFGVLELR